MSGIDGPSAEGPGGTSVGVRGGRGALMGVAGQFAKLAINMLSLIVLARIITPVDYGLIAMVTAVVGVAELVRDMGLSTAAVRATTLSRQQRDNLWWVNTALGAGASIVVCAMAPAIAWFYGEPRLTVLTLVMSLLFVLGGMSTQYSADLVRKLQLGRQALINLVAAGIAFAAALVAAWSGWGYWALALQQVLGAAVGLVLMAVAAGWLPRPYRRGEPMREFFRFGLPLFGSQILTYASGNIDQMLVGRFFGSASLGFYSRGIQIIRMPMNQVRGPLSNAALSTLSRVREDKEAYSRYLAKAQLGVLYPLAIASTGVAAIAPDLVPLLLGPGWAPVAAFVTLFALGDMISSLASAGGWLYLSEGKSGALLRYTVISSVLRIAMFIGAVPLGVHAVAAVYVIAPIFLWPFSLWYCGRATGRRTMPLFRGSLRVFLVTGASFVVAFIVTGVVGNDGVVRLLLTALTYLLTLATLSLIPAVRSDLRTVMEMFGAVLRRR